MIVYCATNGVTGKKYIGCSVNSLNKRMTGHKHAALTKQSQHLFHKSIRKHGWDVFVWEVICECQTKEEMYEIETKLILEMNTLVPNGYNLTEGRDNTTLGYRYTDEQKERYREIRKNMTNPPNKGNRWSDEQKQSLSEKMKNTPNCGENSSSKRPEVREKCSQTKLGEKNPMAKIFLLTYPDGSSIIIEGGISRKLKELGLAYPTLCNGRVSRSGHQLKVLGYVHNRGEIHKSEGDDR